jgi:hypothetical protein
MTPHCALGLLGMKYPWLVRTESLHFAFALITTAGLIALWDIFVNGEIACDCTVVHPDTAPYWKTAFWISIWHLFEHTLLFTQAVAHKYIFGHKEPTSIIQLFIPRVPLHLVYNSAVTIPVLIAMVLFWREAKAVNRLTPIL